jgi:Flp pilus assembly protein TadG
MVEMLRRLFRDDRGGLLSSGNDSFNRHWRGAIAIDVGRMAVLRSQMQNTADARAMAAAVQLDGRDGAQDRAKTVAQDVMSAASAIPSDGSDLKVASVNFYSQYTPTKVVATNDQNAVFVEVVLEARQVNMLFEPVLDLLTAMTQISRRSPLMPRRPRSLHLPRAALMICDYGDLGGGRMIPLRTFATPVTPASRCA